MGGVQVLQCPGESVSVCVPFLFFHSVPETVTCLFHRPLLVLKVCLFFLLLQLRASVYIILLHLYLFISLFLQQ